MNIKSKQSIKYIQTFLYMFLIYLVVTLMKKISKCWRGLWVGGSQNHAIFHQWRNGLQQKFVDEYFFFLVPQMTWNFYSIFLTCMGGFVGIFELIHIYLGIVKSFQTLHYHMVTGGKYGYKTGQCTHILYYTSIPYLERLIWNEFGLEVSFQ